MKVKIKCWNGVATWLWVANDENCGICRMAFNGCCPDCKVPGDDCPLVWGQCSHCFHMHCILKWLNAQQVQQHCPMCRQEWKFKDSMAPCGTLVAATLALLLPPALAWYKPAAGPHHYSVGRAAGLLSSFHGFQSRRRSDSPAFPVGTGTGPLRLEMHSSLRSLVSASWWRGVGGSGGCWWGRGGPSAFTAHSGPVCQRGGPEPAELPAAIQQPGNFPV
ncbi:anaphase-promoting complex subunit 11 [Sigmodon hispidus]